MNILMNNDIALLVKNNRKPNALCMRVRPKTYTYAYVRTSNSEVSSIPCPHLTSSSVLKLSPCQFVRPLNGHLGRIPHKAVSKRPIHANVLHFNNLILIIISS